MGTKAKKSISYIIVMLILSIILFLIEPIVYAGASNGNDFSIVSRGNQFSSAQKNLNDLAETEKQNIDFLFNVNTLKNSSSVASKMADNVNHSGTERYLTLKDFDGDSKYLYAEYLGGGYAVYDRIAEFMYESSKYGSGPFDDYNTDDNLYYGGPTYFYVNTSDTYKHVVTNEILTENNTQNLTDNLNEIREDYLQGEKTELSLSAASTRATTQMFNLGQNISDSQGALKEDAMWYYPSLAVSHQYNTYKDAIKSYELNTDRHAYKDAYCGFNKYGSCAFVALSSVMLYYDRIGKADMVPNDISGFELMYDYEVAFYSDMYANNLTYDSGKYKGYLSDIPKNDMKSEFLHQKLLYNTFPAYRNKSELELKSIGFAYYIEDLGSVYTTFANQYRLNNYSYKYKSNTSYLPEAIVAGNPCIVWLYGSYPQSTTPTDSHAVVAYAFEGTRPLWYTIESVYCNYGYMNYLDRTETYSCIEVNKNFIKGYGNFNIF